MMATSSQGQARTDLAAMIKKDRRPHCSVPRHAIDIWQCIDDEAQQNQHTAISKTYHGTSSTDKSLIVLVESMCLREVVGIEVETKLDRRAQEQVASMR
jgi:hypothetical protein